jgi:uncharacterized MnhB-related membrane protein
MKYCDIFEKLLKYVVMFLIVYLSTMCVPNNNLLPQESLIISTIATCAFAFLEMYYPTVTIIEKNAAV